MAASQANSGYGGTFQTDNANGSPPSYSQFLEVKSIKNSNFQVTPLDVSHLLSPNNTEEFIPSMVRPGTLAMSGNYVGDTTQLGVTTAADARSLVAFKITFPVQKNTKTYTATGIGFWTKWEVGPVEPNRPVEWSGDFQVTGFVTEAVA